MAIVVEEQKEGGSGGGIVSLLIWLTILGAIAAAVYYLFFASPEKLETALPAKLRDSREVANIQLDPEAVMNDSRFQELKSYVTLPSGGNFGSRTNPFEPLR